MGYRNFMVSVNHNGRPWGSTSNQSIMEALLLREPLDRCHDLNRMTTPQLTHGLRYAARGGFIIKINDQTA